MFSDFNLNLINYLFLFFSNQFYTVGLKNINIKHYILFKLFMNEQVVILMT